MCVSLAYPLVSKSSKWLVVPSSLLLLTWVLTHSPSFFQMDFIFSLSGVNLFFAPLLVSLSLWSLTVAYLISGLPPRPNNKSGSAKLFLALSVFLIVFFSTSSVILLYLAFEASLIPILFLILGWGYQPERVYAGLSMLLYTMMASVPLLISLLVFVRSSGSFSSFLVPHLFIASSSIPPLFMVMGVSLGFLVKLPVFGGHLWLPRAHVEAPMEGSMVLAAIMLKLGGYGIFQMLAFIAFNPLGLAVIKNFSLMGGALVSFTCLRQTDLKTLIAYSSVAHMAMAVAASASGKYLGLWAASVAYLSHGFVSSGLFMGANFIYLRSASRNMSAINSTLSFLPLFSAAWLALCLGNMGAPPSPNLIAEIFLITTIITHSLTAILPLAIMATLATAFTLNLYMSTQHLQDSPMAKTMGALAPLELVLLLTHVWPVIVGAIFMLSLL